MKGEMTALLIRGRRLAWLTFATFPQSHVLNVCCPYTSREEMTTAVNAVVSKVQRSEVDAE